MSGDGEGRWRCCWAHRENEFYSHQCAQARPAHPPPPKLARHLRLTNHAALRCQGMGRGGGGAAGRTMKTRNTSIHTSVRRPAQHNPHPQNLHSDPDLQIRQPCGVRGRGRGWCCWAYPGTKIWKVETQGLARAMQPTSRSETWQAGQANSFVGTYKFW